VTIDKIPYMNYMIQYDTIWYDKL